MALHGIPMSKIRPSSMKGPGDFDPPEGGEGPECEECGAEMREDAWNEVYECENCGHTEATPEDPRIADAEYERDYGGMDW